MSNATHTGRPTLKRRDRPRMLRRALLLAYDGALFRGFQRQPGQRTVEGVLIDAMLGLSLSGGLSFASRTDAGVHASGQVVTFSAPEALPDAALLEGLAERLPRDLRLRALVAAPRSFNARWTATGKTYRYRLAAGGERPRAWSPGPLDIGRLEQACERLLVCRKLDGYTGAGGKATEAPGLDALTVEHRSDGLDLVFVGHSFRRYAVRHMTGQLVACAQGEPLESVAERAEQPPPCHGPRAPADGLELERVHYPAGLDPFARVDAIE